MGQIQDKGTIIWQNRKIIFSRLNHDACQRLG